MVFALQLEINEVTIALYAAIVGTLALVWQIIQSVSEHRGKLVVRLYSRSQAPVFFDNSVGQLEEMIITKITNRGRNRRLIDRPYFEIDSLIGNSNIISIINMETKNFPVSLDPGEQFEYVLPANSFVNELRDNGVKKLKARISDTHSKSYKSNWLAIDIKNS